MKQDTEINHSFADIINSKIKPESETNKNKEQIKDAQSLKENN